MRLRWPSPRILATASLVLSYRMPWGHPAQEGLGGLGRIGLDKAAVAVGQVDDEAVGLLRHTADDHQGLAEVALGVARRMGQRHEHLLRPPAVLPDVVLDKGIGKGSHQRKPWIRNGKLRGRCFLIPPLSQDNTPCRWGRTCTRWRWALLGASFAASLVCPFQAGWIPGRCGANPSGVLAGCRRRGGVIGPV